MDFKRGSAGRRMLGLSVVVLLIGVILMLAFRAPPVLVDSAIVMRGPLRGTLESEGRTRVRDRFDVMAPVTGQLGRVLLEPGDAVQRGQALFSVSPLPASLLDARARGQAETALAAAEDALRTARTRVGAEEARAGLAQIELQRVEQVVRRGLMPQASLDEAHAMARQTAAALNSARFAVEVARHQRDNARAALAPGAAQGQTLMVAAPVNGTVLTRRRQSEGPVQAGEAILSLGNLASLEVAVDVLSTDAVRLRPGMRVEIDRWGGAQLLHAHVRRIEPAGFTKVSALGVEEQRV